MTMHQAIEIVTRITLGLTCAALAVLAAGCAAPSGAKGPTRADVLMAAYGELAEGRFVTLADFETAESLELCQVRDVSGEADVALDPRRGRRETGGGALRFTAARDDDLLTIGGGSDPDVYMKRDWRPFDLLLISIHAPRAGTSVRIGLAGRIAERERRIVSPVTLDRGWNLLKFDVAELAERIFLDDVRRIEINVVGANRPTDLLIDDIILTSHREVLMGDPGGVARTPGAQGALYIVEVGRRWRVGATGGFEIGFQNGQIVEWYDPATDPTRLRNFVGHGVLGPTIVVGGAASSGAGEAPDYERAPLGEHIEASQHIVEQSPLRVVIEGTLRSRAAGFSPRDATESTPAGPVESYTYAVYPSGHVHTHALRRAPTSTRLHPSIGVAFSLSTGDGRTVDIGHAAPEARFGVASISLDEDGPFAIFATPRGTTDAPSFSTRELNDGRIDVVRFRGGGLTATDTWRTACRLGRTMGGDPPAAVAEAMIDPPHPRMEVGRMAVESDAPSSDAARLGGCLHIVPERGYVRFTLRDAWPGGMMPTFAIEDSQGREAAVYVDHLIHTRVARDHDGRLLVQLPAGAKSGTRVEILLRSAAP